MNLLPLIWAIASVVACGSQTGVLSNLTAETSGIQFADQRLTPMEQNSDKIFRDLFAWHMAEKGYSPKETSNAVYLTPPEMSQIPQTSVPEDFMSALTERFRQSKPRDWYRYGVDNPPVPQKPKVPQKPITVVVVPGIFGEFISNYPFHEIVTDKKSQFFRDWGAALGQVPDEVFSLAALKAVPKPLGELVKIGSVEIDGKTWVNVIVLEAKLGSLETLGKIDSAIPTYLRRLDKIFKTITDETDLYLLGYSRGAVVTFELARQATELQATHPWAKRIKGLVNLGGVVYGTAVADVALSDPNSDLGKTASILRQLVKDLKGDPRSGIQDDYKLAARAKVVAENSVVWATALRKLTGGGANTSGVAPDKTAQYFADELKIRRKVEKLQNPDIMGTFTLIRRFAFELFTMQRPVKEYFANVEAFKLLITRVIEGVETLTIKSRMEWWQQSSLPPSVSIFSITGTMPDQTEEGRLSPLFDNPNYGKGMYDFNSVLRGGFYTTAKFDHTEMNDSQVVNYRARYWPELYPSRANKSYYLGSFGTHHWGFSFPVALANANGEINPFPRTVLMTTLASFVAELEAAEAD